MAADVYGRRDDSGIRGEDEEHKVTTVEVKTLTASISFTGALAADEDQSSSSSSEIGDDGSTSGDLNDMGIPDPVLRSNKRRIFSERKHQQSLPKRERSVRKSVVSLPDLLISDDHFAAPKGNFCTSTIQDLEQAIAKFKSLAREVNPHTEQARQLIERLVQLRLKLLEAKEGPMDLDPRLKSVMGHVFQERPWGRAKGYCEQCCAVIIGIVQSWMQCKECGFCCHRKCLNSITRTCAAVKIEESPTFIIDICQEKGLHTQNYRCAECRTAIGFQPGFQEARLCDYTGSFYCDHCHWNDTMLIPARIVRNWDFEPRKVSRASKAFLKLMVNKPVLNLQAIIPMIFSFIEELKDLKDRREELLTMKSYFLQCPDALKSKLLCQLQNRQHFVESSELYSLQDLIDLSNDVLLPSITKIHLSLAQHIKTECETCRSKGVKCELCEMDELLYPFDGTAVVCKECSNIVHLHCLKLKNDKCPSCQRNSEMKRP